MNKDKLNNEVKDESMPDQTSWGNTLPSDLAMGDITESDFGSKKKSNLNKGTIFLLVTCAIGVGVMYLFGIKQKPKEASAEEKAVEAQVDQALKKLVDQNEQGKVKDLFKDTNEMVQAFYDYPSKQQVALEELQKNPFCRVIDAKETETKVDEKALQREKERVLREAQTKLAQLQLQSVLKSTKGSTCLINGEIFKVGQKVGEIFTIQAIEDNKVTLAASENQFVLEM
jgi:hypothetical protein